MAITQTLFNGNGSNLGPFTFDFKWLEPTDIKVTVGGVLKTAGTHYNLQSLNYTTKNGGQVLFTAGNAPANNATIRVYRDTDDSALSATFFSGSAIRSQDLNDNFTQALYVTQEASNNIANAVAGQIPDGTITTLKLADGAVTNDKVTSLESSKVTFAQLGTGAVQRTVESKMRDVVSVKDFGAVGNGVADDTAAIQAALNSGAKNITLPIGTFLSGLLTLPTGVSLYGEGGVLKAITNTFFQVVIPVNSSYSTIQGITFDATNLVPGSSIAPYPTGEASCIATGSTTVGTIKGLTITDCRFLNIPRNYATNPQRVHSILFGYGEATITNCYTEQCGGDIYNFNAGQFIVTNCIAKDSGDGGIAFNNGARGTIADNYIYKCDLGIGSGHQGTTASPDNSFVVSGNEIVACGDGINMGWFSYVGLTAPRHVKISSNTIRRCKRVGIRYDGQPDPTWEAFLIIEGNSIYDSGSTDFDGTSGTGDGLVIGDCNNALISSNAFFNNKNIDLILYGLANVVENNIFDGGSYSGTGVVGLLHEGEDQIITGNVFDGKHLLIQNSAGSCVTNNTFKNVPGTGANVGSLIVIGTNTTIDGNYFTDCGNAIYFPNLATWFANDVLQANRFNNCINKAVNSPLSSQYGSFYEQVTFTGTCNGSGNLVIPHGTASNGRYIALAQAFYKGNSNESVPMTLSFADGTNIQFSGGVSGRTARACIVYNKDFDIW